MIITNKHLTPTILADSPENRDILTAINKPFWVSWDKASRRAQLSQGQPDPFDDKHDRQIPDIAIEQLGAASFRETYGVRCAFYAGAMANEIASTDMVIALGKAGLMGSFGAAGLTMDRLEEAIEEIQTALPQGPYAFNLIHSPYEADLEEQVVARYLRKKIDVVEASAFLKLTPAIVHYRASGLHATPSGVVAITNRVIAKLSRTEVAEKFLQPAPASMLEKLYDEGKITREQVVLAGRVPVADDITVEADSGGHTDNRPLNCLMPTMLALRDRMQEKYAYAVPVRIGAGGGISTPAAALGAFMMGAAYVVTGSINQACVESGASPHTKRLLGEAGMADVTMAPSADMFEMGVKVQVLKRGTLFPMRALKLYDIYTRYDSINAIPSEERQKLETQIFQRELESVWQETVRFFETRDPLQLERAEANPKRKMALIFRWYLGLSSRWSNVGDPNREMDYQIWCGPAMGSFNDWTHETYLAEPGNRRIVDVTLHLFSGAAYLYRIQLLNLHGVQVPVGLSGYTPQTALED